jgi:predicted HicB family RNase H-like nuclease
MKNENDLIEIKQGLRETVEPQDAAGKVAKKSNRVTVNVQLPPVLLKRIDAAAKQRGISRSAWIISVASKALDPED